MCGGDRWPRQSARFMDHSLWVVGQHDRRELESVNLLYTVSVISVMLFQHKSGDRMS
ncbi:hypothetical protein M427DRAFT_59781 [Gonapodya prolifera JEL478]|uniref:Uncharacterized protein n=1 Tax=Gonapodya prolifera (strain JEL478) TaxID=1344416 RepID=A0A139A603_GONPJ|nr:hypothetical protein M427DRAFT_59781 [Gonapodya prolifera JEL478]|eukprot:KXS12098.1 hypothetical protein M427DRAFT_59781 [Gonapodya prolifera JEL478]